MKHLHIYQAEVSPRTKRTFLLLTMNASAPQIVNGSATGTLNNLRSALEDEAALSELGNITAEKYASS